MTVLLGLLAFFLILDVAALTGWAPSTHDSRDWRRAGDANRRRGPVHMPAEWLAASASTDRTPRLSTTRHSPGPVGVTSSEPGAPGATTTCGARAA